MQATPDSLPAADAPIPGFKFLTGPFGRTLFALPFGIFGVMHFTAGEQMAAVVPAWLPGATFWVYFTGAALLAGAIAIAVDKLALYAGLGLAILLLSFILTVHLPGLADEATMQYSMVSLLKDFALMGAALGYAGLAGRKSQ